MRFALSEEQLALRAVLRRTLEDESRLGSSDDRHTMDVTVWRRLASDGWVGLGVPAELGGQGAGTLELALLMHEVGRTLSPEPFLGTVALGLPALLALADRDVRDRLVSEVVGGDRIVTAALHSATGSWDLPAVEGDLRRSDGGATLTTRRAAVPDADVASTFLVAVRTPDAVQLVAVPRSGAVEVTDPVGGIDLARTYADISFVEAGCEALGDVSVGAWLDVADILVAAELVGVSERCLELALDHARSRYQFGRAIGSFQATKHRCVDMFVEVELARAAVEYAAWAVDGRPDAVPLAAATALAAAVETAVQVTQETVHVHGGIGFTWEHVAHRYLRRARALAALVGGRNRAIRLVVERAGWAQRAGVPA